MPIDERWRKLGPEDWKAFARAWLAELREVPDDPGARVSQSVVMMSFTATPEQQWQFVRAAVDAAESVDELGAIAAGPVEHLLGKHGGDYIAALEAQATADPKFAEMLTLVRRFTMTEEVWSRVQTLKARYNASFGSKDPTRPSDENGGHSSVG